MNNHNKVKKSISREEEIKLINWDIGLMNFSTWEIYSPKINTSKYKLRLNNKKEFMKKWTDRKLNIAIKKDLSLLEKEIVFDCLDYIDTENIINFKMMSVDFNYSASKISKAKKSLQNKWIIREKNKFYYLNPLVGIKSKEIDQELIGLFKDTFEKYGVDITY